MSDIKIAVIYFGEGAPDPYNFNDAIQHVGGGAHFDWFCLDSDNRPTHYIMSEHMETLNRDVDGMMQNVIDAGNLLQDRSMYERGIVDVTDYSMGIAKIDVDSYDMDTSDLRFTLSDHPDIWISVMWRA